MTFQTVVQTNLQKMGLYSGAIDGALGPKSYQGILADLSHHIPAERLPAFPTALSTALPAGGIDSPLRICHFLAQIAHESGGFQYWFELGNTAYFQKYEGRHDLGNIVSGDGYRFRGRGLIQLTGRSNYASYGAKLSLDLIGNPDLASTTEVAVELAVSFWNSHGLSAYADKDDIQTITHRINGGLTGLADRQLYLTKLKSLFGVA